MMRDSINDIPTGDNTETCARPPVRLSLRRKERTKKTTHWDCTEHNICHNCGNRTSGKYCAECGQKTNTIRLKFGSSIRSFFTSFFQVERGFLATIRMLFTRPGYLSREYIDGKRTSRTNPFTVMFLVATIYGILYTAMILSTKGAPDAMNIGAGNISLKGIDTNMDGDSKFFAILDFIINKLQQSVVLLYLLMLPIYTFIIKVFSWRANRGRYNYTELMFMGGYLASQLMLLSIMTLPFRWTGWGVGSDFYDITVLCVYIWLPAFTLRQFFGWRWAKAVWKTIVVYLMSLIAAGALVALAAGIVLGIYYLATGNLDPDLIFKPRGNGAAADSLNIVPELIPPDSLSGL